MVDGIPEPGDVIATKYVIENVLGRGGMGTVFGVVHRETGKRLALKCLLPMYVSNPSVVERFIREAKAVGRIQHRHVIDIFDYGRDGSVLYMVLPLLEGMPLCDLLLDEQLTLEQLLVTMIRAMEGVAAAHALGVLHRDLKPSNIFVCRGVSGQLDDPRVLDFGISKLDDERDQSLTRSGVAVGTPYYMPLEQLTGQRDLDARVDVYAMGVILYEAISGVLPHSADNVAALALRLMHTPPLHLSARRPDISKELGLVVMRALAQDREQRYPTMRALIDATTQFVPNEARFKVAPSAGPRLRTPRDLNDPEASPQLGAAAATTAPAHSQARVLTPVGGDPGGPRAGQQAAASMPPNAGRRGRVAGAVTLTLLGGLLAILIGSNRPPPSRSPTTPETGARTEREAALGRADASTLAEVVPPMRVEPAVDLGATPQPLPMHTLPQPAIPVRRNARGVLRKPRATSAPASDAAVGPPPEPVQAPEANPGSQPSVETRAGGLAPEEF